MNEENQSQRDVVTRRMKQVFVLFAIIGGFFIFAEHRAHLIPYLPWLFLAACPLMHMFMHHGHKGHHQHGNTGDSGGRSNGPLGPGSASAPVSRSTNPPGPPQPPHGERS
jgi:hypothetical protein